MRLVLLALTILLSMFPVVLAGVASDDEFLHAKVVLYLGDVPSLLLTVVSAPLVVRRLRSRLALDAPTLWMALLVVLCAAFALHPSAEGVRTLARVLMALAIIVVVAEARSLAERRLVIGALGVAAALQATIAVLQVIRGGPIGLDMLGEWQAPLTATGRGGGMVMPEGTMQHPYLLAALSLLAALAIVRQMVGARESGWSPAVLLAIAPAGFTYGRTSLAVIAMACASLARGALARRPLYRLSIVLLLVGFGVPALLGLEGWTARTTVLGVSPNGREIFLRQAVALIAAQPLTGVGPGRELLALRELRDRDPVRVTHIDHAHSVPVLVTVEAGVGGGVVVLALLVAVGFRSLRIGGATFALFVGYVPFMLLDHFPYTQPHGLVLSAVWLGLLENFAEDPGS